MERLPIDINIKPRYSYRRQNEHSRRRSEVLASAFLHLRLSPRLSTLSQSMDEFASVLPSSAARAENMI